MTTPPATTPPFTAAMDLLRHGVPLSLLLDLASGPHSRELLEQERRDAGRGADRVVRRGAGRLAGAGASGGGSGRAAG